MKIILIATLLTLFTSCATKTSNPKKIENAQFDSLSAESYMRWGEKRLISASESDLVVGCYQGKIEETLQVFKNNFSKLNSIPHYWLQIGNCYFLKNELSKAQLYYRIFLEESTNMKDKAMAHNNLGLILLKKEHWQNARSEFEKAIAGNKELKVPVFNLAQLYLHFGHYDKVINLLKSSVWGEHQDIDVNHSLATAYLYKGNLEEARKYYKLIPKDMFRRDDIATTYSIFLLKNGDVKTAEEVMSNRLPASSNQSSAVKVENLIRKKAGK